MPAHVQALLAAGLVLVAYAVAARLPGGSAGRTAVYEGLGFAMVLAYARAPQHGRGPDGASATTSDFGRGEGPEGSDKKSALAPRHGHSQSHGHGASLRLAGLLALGLLPAWLLGRSLWAQAWRLAPNCMADAPALAGLLWQHAVAVALPEECFWRGYVQPALAKRWPTSRQLAGAPFGAAHVAASALFALSHIVGGGAWLRLSTLLPGLVFAWLASRSRSIAGPWLLHLACNCTALWADRCLPIFPS